MSAHGGDKYIYCSVCDFKSVSPVQHKKHMNVAHMKTKEKSKTSDKYVYCEVCNFRADSVSHLEKHKKVAHLRNNPKLCTFYLRGNCLNGNQCPFSHENNQGGEGFTEVPCWFQSNCLRENCLFAHYENFLDQDIQNQPPPMCHPRVWRPWY